jgi:hypothetical protein
MEGFMYGFVEELLGNFEEVDNRAGYAVLHDQPKIVVLEE